MGKLAVLEVAGLEMMGDRAVAVSAGELGEVFFGGVSVTVTPPTSVPSSAVVTV